MMLTEPAMPEIPKRDYHQLGWDSDVEEDCRQIIRLAVHEDLERTFDWTTVALVPAAARGAAVVVARQAGVIAGMPAARLALEEMDPAIEWSLAVKDGALVAAGETLAAISGSARSLLSTERLLLNLIGRLSGVATLTRRYVDAVSGSQARIYDTRKTTPGWRRLEKYAVRCGGGNNHRTGLFDGVLIKDNHLSFGQTADGPARFTPAQAVLRAREFLAGLAAEGGRPSASPLSGMIVEVEVDTLRQLDDVLTARPDIVLLDNMSTAELREAVARRNARAAEVELEASGGVNLQTVAVIAATGVDRISVGALTHSAICLDVALDWRT